MSGAVEALTRRPAVLTPHYRHVTFRSPTNAVRVGAVRDNDRCLVLPIITQIQLPELNIVYITST